MNRIQTRLKPLLLSLLLITSLALAADSKPTSPAASKNPLAAVPTLESCKDGIQQQNLTAVPAAAGACVCYCGGRNWSIGSIACMGGFKQRCVDNDGKGGQCGWNTVKRGQDAVRCDGGEHCK